ncbi:MAG TPA: cation:proton antiporter, partial [Terriglobales bacterium]|nr:cation:proton antiporter [Terriglobales bacterium]
MSTPIQVLLLIAVLIVVAKLCGSLSARFGLPLVLGELLAGILLGPTVFNVGVLPMFQSAEGAGAVPAAAVFKVLAEIGVVLLMFVAGLETDVPMLRDAISPAFWAAAGGMIAPMGGAIVLCRIFGFGWPESIFVGTILTATSVTITAQTLMNLKKIRSMAGSTILGAAVIDDVLGLLVLSVVIAVAPQMMNGSATNYGALGMTVLRMVVCLVFMGLAGRPLTRWIFKMAEKMHGHHTELAAALILVFLFSFQAEWLGGMAAITGAYVAGLFVAADPVHERVKNEIHAMTNSFFGPLFLVSIGLGVNARNLGQHAGFLAMLTTIAVVGKIFGSGVGARVKGLSTRESIAVGVGMIPRGEVGLITASLGLAAGLVSQDIYVQMVVLVLVTTIITPALLKFVFSRVPVELESRQTIP